MTDLGDQQSRRRWFEATIADLHLRFAPLTEGAPASYIPELATVDPEQFAIAGGW